MTNFRQAVIWVVLFGFMMGMALVLDVRVDRRVEMEIEPGGVVVHRWRQSSLRSPSLATLDWEAIPRNYDLPPRVTIDESMDAGVLSELLNRCAMYGHGDPVWRIGDGAETVYEFPGCSCGGRTEWPDEGTEDLRVTETPCGRVCYVNLRVTPEGILLNDIGMTLGELEHAIDIASGNRRIEQRFMMLIIDPETELSSLQNLMALIAQDGWKYQMTFPDESS